ncbi:hypothetical protein M8J77_010740 [Diaphorina citri]|nr:hypothetical protein M8J77_010740 [Diaphorina citri]
MWELTSAIKSLKPHSSPGPDDIHNQMFFHLTEKSKSLLLRIFNQMWKENSFPSGWKKSIIIPIPKPNKDKTLPENMRPISLTSCLCKLFERLVIKRLNFFLESNHLLALEQSGCRKNTSRSCLDNLVNLQTEISDAIVNKQYLLCVFYDIVGAYDCVQKSVILKQLSAWNMRGHLPAFISNYLDPRTFQIRLNNSVMSKEFSLVCGIPQGGVISGALFAIAINAISSYINPLCSSSLFVDDYAIFMRDKSKDTLISIIQQSIDNLLNFSQNTGLYFSPQKTKSILFCRKNKHVNDDITLTMYGQRIEVVNETKFLGLTFDRKMHWSPHVKNIKKSCLSKSKILKTLSKKAWASDRKMLLRMYKALIRSRIDYGSPVYKSATDRTLQMLNPVQNLCLRLATGAFRSSPVVSLEAETGEPCLKIRRDILTSNYISKVLSCEKHPNLPIIQAPKYHNKYENLTKIKPTIGIQRNHLKNEISFDKIQKYSETKEPKKATQRTRL